MEVVIYDSKSRFDDWIKGRPEVIEGVTVSRPTSAQEVLDIVDSKTVSGTKLAILLHTSECGAKYVAEQRRV